NLLAELGKVLKQITGFEVKKPDWRTETLPLHLKMRFEVIDREGQLLKAGRNLGQLKKQLAEKPGERPQTKIRQPFEREDIQDWDFGELPETIETEESGYVLRQYPAVSKEGSRIALRLFPTKEDANDAMAAGLRLLILKKLKQECRYLDKNLQDLAQHCLLFSSLACCDVLKNDLYESAVQSCFIENNEYPKNKTEFARMMDKNIKKYIPEVMRLSELLGQILPEWHALIKQLKGSLPLNRIEATADIKTQLENLVYPGFLTATPREWLNEIPRYLKAIQLRLIKLDQTPDKDRLKRVELEPLLVRLKNIDIESLTANEKIIQYRWQLEELRVSLFAQELGTKTPVSVKRLDRLWKEVNE
ncbi:MAG TPA: DUF3418 domain-containing protein, partial [Thiotrichales bacterium]|nr:DUF3418 domain-containing protein [Thiotrichales bacterium]